MDLCDSLRLRKNWTLLLDSVNSEDVTPYLIQDLVLEPDVVDEINAQTTRKRKTEALLTRLLKAGPSAYDSFRRALAQQHVVYSEVISKLDNTDVVTHVPRSSSGVDTPDSKFTFPQFRGLRLADSKDVPESSPGTLMSTEPVQPIAAQPAEIPVSTRPFSDAECLSLAQFLGPEDLNSVGVKLEFFAAALRRYEQDNRRGAGGYEGMYNMLVDWKKNCLNSEQREKLSGALEQAGHANFAYQVRYGYKLESSPVQPTSVVPAPPLTPGRSDPNPSPSGWSQASSTSPSQPLSPPGPLRSDIVSPVPTVTLPVHIQPSHGRDVTDMQLLNLTEHLDFKSYNKLGLCLGFDLNQLAAFRTQHCNDVTQAGLEMLSVVKKKVGYIRKEDMENLLLNKVKLPSLVQYVTSEDTH